MTDLSDTLDQEDIDRRIVALHPTKEGQKRFFEEVDSLYSLDFCREKGVEYKSQEAYLLAELLVIQRHETFNSWANYSIVDWENSFIDGSQGVISTRPKSEWYLEKKLL